MIHGKPIKKFKNMTKEGKGVLASWRCWPPLRSQEALSALERGDRRAAPGERGLARTPHVFHFLGCPSARQAVARALSRRPDAAS